MQSLQEVKDILALYDITKRVFVDLETTSYDDETPALFPYKGTRATLFIIGQVGVATRCIILRHDKELVRCVADLDGTIAELQRWALTLTCVANLNIKFDMHVTGMDGVFFSNARIEDTGALARIVYNEHMSYSLENLCKYYNVKQKESAHVKEWVDANNTKNYGRIPLDILIPYGIADVDAAMDLHYLLLGKLPEESVPIWDSECDLTPILFEAERDGLIIDKKFLLQTKLHLLTNLIAHAQEIQEETGINNPSSAAQYGAYFSSHGITSNKKTKGGNDSWDKSVLTYVSSLGNTPVHKIARKLIQYGEQELAESTFCTGWLKHVCADGRMHFNVRQTGTVSLRSSSSDPNTQNIPKWMMESILIEKGHVGIEWDLSQIEYRLFAHYANSPSMLAKYEANPKVDFHQILADELGIPRDPTKRVNFGILYGMGKGKTTMTLRNEIMNNDSDVLRNTLYGNYYDPTEDPPLIASGVDIPAEVLEVIVNNILIQYHVKAPEIKKLQAEIKRLLKARGYVKSYYGMRFYLDVDHAYVGLNRVIQGTAATLFKKKTVELMRACKREGLQVKLKLQVHDAVSASVPLEQANAYVKLAHDIVTDCPFRVPVLMDFKLALYNWKNKIKIKYTDDVLQEVGKLCFAK